MARKKIKEIKEIPKTIYGERFDPYLSYDSGQSLADACIPRDELGIGALVSNFDSGINPMSFDNQASSRVGSDIYSFFRILGKASIKLLDRFSEAVKTVYEQGYFNNKN